MPQGNYPDWKDKYKTKPHPAKGLSKNKYDAEGNLRPPRKSRSKLAPVKEAMGMKPQDDMATELRRRRGMLALIDDDEVGYVDNPHDTVDKGIAEQIAKLEGSVREKYKNVKDFDKFVLDKGKLTTAQLVQDTKGSKLFQAKEDAGFKSTKITSVGVNKYGDKVKYRDDNFDPNTGFPVEWSYKPKYPKGQSDKSSLGKKEVASGDFGPSLELRELLKNIPDEIENQSLLLTKRGAVRKRASGAGGISNEARQQSMDLISNFLGGIQTKGESFLEKTLNTKMVGFNVSQSFPQSLAPPKLPPPTEATIPLPTQHQLNIQALARGERISLKGYKKKKK